MVGGTFLYFKGLYEGLFEGPSADPEDPRRESAAGPRKKASPPFMPNLSEVDPVAAGRIHPNDLRRIERALEVFKQSGQRISDLQQEWGAQIRRP